MKNYPTSERMWVIAQEDDEEGEPIYLMDISCTEWKKVIDSVISLEPTNVN